MLGSGSLVASTRTSSGEGERRAIRGFAAQYSIAASLIYQHICSGELSWVGLADRSAASFDDVVLGLKNRVHAYQIKSKRDPEAIAFNTLLLGADDLLQKLVRAWETIRESNNGIAVELTYVTSDFPRTTDAINGSAGPRVSSAAFYRTHGANHETWLSTDWQGSDFSVFWKRLHIASGLSEDEFVCFWRCVNFQSGLARGGGIPHTATFYDQHRIEDLAALLPILVSEASDQDRWDAAEIMQRLNWKSPTSLRHPHIFPVDLAVQTNPKTEAALLGALTSVEQGYLSLLGPPGSGKSTLLQATLLPTPKAAIMRYLAFVPDERHGLGRAEAIDFLHDIVTQLNDLGLGDHVFPGSDLPELRSQLEYLLLKASERYRNAQIKTIVVIDGLDHVPREETPTRSFLAELPLPEAIPKGVLVLLGSQRLDLNDLPPSVAGQAGRRGRSFEIAPLPKESIVELAKLGGLSSAIDLNKLYTVCGGHPLIARYLIAKLASAAPDEAGTILSDEHVPGEQVEDFYRKAWHDLEKHDAAKSGLAYLALVEGSIAATELDKLVGSDGTDAVWKVAGHLLRADASNRLSIFHNSFRLFLLEQTNLRFGRRDDAALRRRYSDLAEMAKNCSQSDPQRWLELRYRSRSEDDLAVLTLATPDRFRTQFAERRNPADIHADIRLALKSSATVRNPEKLFELILARHELESRTAAIEIDSLWAISHFTKS